MGKCLSKQSKKAKDGEDPDRTPYTPASQRTKDGPTQLQREGTTPGAETNKQPAKVPEKDVGEDLAKEQKQTEPESVWVKVDGSPVKEVDTSRSSQRQSRSPPREKDPKKPVPPQTEPVKPKSDNEKQKPNLDVQNDGSKPKVEVKSFNSSRTTSVVSSSSHEIQSKQISQTVITSSTTETPLDLRESKSFSGEPRPDTSLFSKTAPTAIDKSELGVLSVKEIRSQRTSKIETKKEAHVIATSESTSKEQPMALLGALKYLKPLDGQDPCKDNVSKVSSSSVTSQRTSVTTTSKVNGEITSEKTITTEKSSTSPNMKTTISTTSEEVSSVTRQEKPAIFGQLGDGASSALENAKTSDSASVTSSIPEKTSSFTNGNDAVTESTSDAIKEAPAKATNKTAAPVSPDSKIPPPSSKIIASQEKPTLKPVNGETLVENGQNGASITSEEISDSTYERSIKAEGETSDESLPVKNIVDDYKNIFVSFTQYNERIISKHEITPNTRMKPLRQIEEWLKTDNEGRVTVAIGAGGVGKTCLAATVCRKYSQSLLGSHFFRYNSPNVSQNRLRDVLISLAYQFCDVLPNYCSLLPKLEKLKDLIRKDDLPELYNALLFYPFTGPSLKCTSDEKMLIVIDALDECDPQDVSVLTDVINNLNESCPKWISVFVTCRADGDIAEKLNNVTKVELKRKDPENMSDIKKYLKDPLGLFMDRISLDGGLTTLTKKTQGSFTCAEIFKNRLSKQPGDAKIALREVTTLYPDGLEQNLKELLRAYKERLPSDKEVKNAYLMITSVIACSLEPLSLDFIFDLVGAKYFELCKEAVKEELGPIMNLDGEKVEFINHCIIDWLFDSKAGEFRLDREVGRRELSTLCGKWIIGNIEGDLEVESSLKEYSLKHSIYHLTDSRGNTDTIGKMLCSLKYAREKLCLPGVNLNNLLDDYEHQHMLIGSDKVITVKDYMRKNPQTWENIRMFEKFINEKKLEISTSPKFVMHIAANYSRLEKIQQNAKAELANEPWLEDLTAVPQTTCISKTFGSLIRAVDISPDGKTIAVIVKDEDLNIKLYILNGQTGEEMVKPIDIKSLNDRVGVLAKCMPDGNNIFVGSITTFISKQGKQIPSGLDATTVDLKEKFSIECCDVSVRYFGLGLTTFPWGGKSLHLSVFDMKTKKCLNTVEILRFRFGGSNLFCIKSIGLAKERPLICACIKQSTKPQLRVIVWNITKFQVVNSIDVNNDDITKSIFIADHTLILGAGLRTSSSSKSSSTTMSEYWNFKEVTNKSSNPWDASEMHSLIAAHEDMTVACRWYSANGAAVLEQWRGDDIKAKPLSRHKIRGLSNVSDMQVAANVLLFVSGEDIYLYNVFDLEPLDSSDASRVPNISELVVDSLVFLPKSDTAIITSKRDDYYSVYLCDLSQDDPSLVPTQFDKIKPTSSKSIGTSPKNSIFTGPTASSERCFPSADGNYLFFNGGDHVKVLDLTHKNTKNIPSLRELNESPVYNEYTAVKATSSMKDNFIAVVYGQIPNKIFLFDVRSCNLLRKIYLNSQDDKSGVVSDFTFMPAMGYLITYHQDKINTLAAWNSRTGDQLSEVNLQVAYSKPSPALDRFAVSTCDGSGKSSLILRNADNKFCKTLPMGDKDWLADNDKSDVEFSSDGTILVGICQQTGLNRVWNAANGEALQDLPSLLNGPADVVGMLTNTHVLFHDDRLQALDVASGDLIAVLPLEHQVERRSTARGLRISGKGTVVSGATSDGILCIVSCHNFVTVKRKTTLQRMKSFRK